jgi:protein-S-isoprenylcysteine O-methyltransferase Ste14
MGILLIVPVLLLRYGWMRILNPNVLSYAAIFPHGEGHDAWQTKLNAGIINGIVFSPIFARIHFAPIGWVIYGAGLIVLAIAVMGFSMRNTKGFCDAGIYRYSRNPMYVGYVLAFLGTGVLIQAWFYWLFFVPFMLTLPAVIRAEEAWCIRAYGESYRHYMDQVHRYWGRN